MEGQLAAANEQPIPPTDPDGPWQGEAKYKVTSNIESTLDVVTIRWQDLPRQRAVGWQARTG